MSSPRAAMSVATRIATLFCLKSFSARTRCGWLLLPWMATARDAVEGQLLGESVGAVLGAREDERLVDAARLDEVAEQLALAAPIDRDDELLDQLGGGVLGRHLDEGRVLQEVCGEAADLSREGGAEEQVLARHGKQREDLADVVDEAHVEHPVGLVEHEHLDPRQVDRALR